MPGLSAVGRAAIGEAFREAPPPTPVGGAIYMRVLTPLGHMVYLASLLAILFVPL